MTDVYTIFVIVVLLLHVVFIKFSNKELFTYDSLWILHSTAAQ